MKEWICSVMEPMNREWKFVAKQELVRCKDCKHNTSSSHNPVCELDMYRSGGADWFCADGERKVGQGNKLKQQKNERMPSRNEAN